MDFLKLSTLIPLFGELALIAVSGGSDLPRVGCLLRNHFLGFTGLVYVLWNKRASDGRSNLLDKWGVEDQDTERIASISVLWCLSIVIIDNNDSY